MKSVSSFSSIEVRHRRSYSVGTLCTVGNNLLIFWVKRQMKLFHSIDLTWVYLDEEYFNHLVNWT